MAISDVPRDVLLRIASFVNGSWLPAAGRQFSWLTSDPQYQQDRLDALLPSESDVPKLLSVLSRVLPSPSVSAERKGELVQYALDVTSRKLASWNKVVAQCLALCDLSDPGHAATRAVFEELVWRTHVLHDHHLGDVSDEHRRWVVADRGVEVRFHTTCVVVKRCLIRVSHTGYAIGDLEAA
jgi:hypothetical protein